MRNKIIKINKDDLTTLFRMLIISYLGFIISTTGYNMIVVYDIWFKFISVSRYIFLGFMFTTIMIFFFKTKKLNER